MAETSGSGDGADQDYMLERLLTRLALTEDSKLEGVLAKLLPYAISCLSSTRPSTKQKVIDMLTHINKRVKDQPSIKLPLLDLLRLYQTELATPMVRSFALVYMEMAMDRRSKEELEVAPDLLLGISQLPIQHQDILLRMAAKEMEKYAFEQLDESFAEKYKFLNTAADQNIFIDFCLQTVIYQPPPSSTQGLPVPPSGLSRLQAIRVSGKSPLKGDNLMIRKLGLLNVIAEFNLVPELVYPLFVTASVDSNDRVARRGEELLKKKASAVNLEDPLLIRRLFSIFQGSVGNDGIPEDSKIAPASPVLKGRLMGVFMRSVAAANTFPATLQCVFDCIYGNESNLRLKQAGMEFTVWVFKHASSEQLKHMAPIILSSIVKLLDREVPTGADSSSKQLRLFAYQAIGQLGQRAPHLFRGSTELAFRLFGALKIEPQSIRFTVQEAVNSVAFAYKDCGDLIAREVETLLLENSQAEEGEARFCAVLWAIKVFNLKHCPSRYICMLGASDSKLDIREMAAEGLLPSKHDDGAQEEYPSMKDMMKFICQQQPKVLVPAEVGEKDLLFPTKTYVAMIMFIQKCYEQERQEEKSMHQASGLSDSSSPGAQFRLLLEHAMASDGSIELHETASSALLSFAAGDSKKFGELYCDRLEWLKQYLGHINSTTRETVARLLGIVTSVLSTSKAVNLLQELKATFEGTGKGRLEDAHGAVCATGYVLAECIAGMPTVPSELLRAMTTALLRVGRSGNPLLAGSVAEALGHTGLRRPLHLLYEDKTTLDMDFSVSGEMEQGAMEKHTSGSGELKREDGLASETGDDLIPSVILLLNEVLSSKETKSVQKAAIAFGHLCFSSPTKEMLEAAVTALLSQSRSKVEDILFSAGEALSFIWGGVPITADEILRSTFGSLSRATKFLTGDIPTYTADSEMLAVSETSSAERATAREMIVHKLFDELVLSARKEERCAGAVWLLSIVTYCGRHPRVQEMLPEFQDAFSHLLGEQNELTQEMASSGMSLVYELGDASTKDELVKALVGTLSGTAKKKRAVKLMEDSEVFEEGVFGETPGGGNIGTYKELCNLANEMGQPDLIYKFMDLANYQASLNSKRGAAFGFARIAKQAGDTLRPYLRTLVPKLLRYQYDPNKHIQDAMGHIWRSLVAEPKKTVDEYLDDIMEDLLLQGGSRLWRSRESSCLALADILQGRRFHEVGKYLERIWTMAFRAIDDIKETVRTAGSSLCRAISMLTLRLSDMSLTDEIDARATVTIVLPYLLSKGVLSNVSDIRQLSVNTVMKLAKSAGSTIRPQLPDLIICMLESLSSLEDQRLNYAELHAERVGINAEKLESLRIAVAKDSPMWETLDLCIRQVDSSTLELLGPRLLQLIRSGVGLNTRVGVAKFITLLTQQLGSEMKQHTGPLLKVLLPVVKSEKSLSSKRAFASTCATVAKHASQTQILQVIEDSVALYTSSTDKDAHVASAYLLKEFSRQAAEIFKGYYTFVLPVAFVARFDEEQDISRIFEDIWEENTSSENVSLQLYTSDIVPLLLKGILSTSWTQKQRSAKAVARIAEVAGDSLGPFVQQLLNAILEEIPGRLWEGKEIFLDAVAAICTGCHKVILKETEAGGVSPDAISTVIIAACSKKKSSFRDKAFSCLDQVLNVFKDQNLSMKVLPFLLDCCNQAAAPKTVLDPVNKSSQDEKDSEGNNVSLEKVLGCIRSSLTASAPIFVNTEGEKLLECLVGVLGGGQSWQVKQSALSATQAFVSQIQTADSTIIKESDRDSQRSLFVKFMEPLIQPILDCISNIKVSQVRIAALDCLTQMYKIDQLRLSLSKDTMQTIKGRMLYFYETEKNASAKSLIQELIVLIDMSFDGKMQD